MITLSNSHSHFSSNSRPSSSVSGLTGPSLTACLKESRRFGQAFWTFLRLDLKLKLRLKLENRSNEARTRRSPSLHEGGRGEAKSCHGDVLKAHPHEDHTREARDFYLFKSFEPIPLRSVIGLGRTIRKALSIDHLRSNSTLISVSMPVFPPNLYTKAKKCHGYF